MRGRRRSRAPRFGGSGRKPQCSYCHYTPLDLFVNTQHAHGNLKPPPTTPDASTAPKPHATPPTQSAHGPAKRAPTSPPTTHTTPRKETKNRGESTSSPPIPWP